MRRRAKARLTAAVSIALGAATLSACGTRLPNSAFVAAGANAVPGQQTPGAVTGPAAANQASPSSDQAAASASGTGPTSLSGGAGPTAAATSGAVSNGGPSASGATPAASNGPNTASDVGVTPSSILVGNVTGVNGPLGPDAFGPTLNGLRAYIAATNARGGINGRKLILDYCDDGQDGASNLSCTQKLVGQDHVFALLDNNSLSTAPSAHYEYQQGVPDLGFPLNNGYYKYPNMFSVQGSSYPRDGTQVGQNGTNFNTSGVYRFFKQVVGVTKAAFFFYSESSSQSAAYLGESEAAMEGIPTVYESGGHDGENLAAPNFDADVLAMKQKNVDVMFDDVDITGNEKICASMDRYGIKLKAKVGTVEIWSQALGTPAWSSPCRDSIYLFEPSDSYADLANPSVAQFRQDFATYSRGSVLHQWSLEAYAGGYTFQDAVSSMGADVTRKGFMAWLDDLPSGSYSDHGFYTPFSWKNSQHPHAANDCNQYVQWQDSVDTFVTRSHGPGGYDCYVTQEVGTPFSPDGS